MDYIDPKEFIDSGLLQEANRMFFHPRGLAMTVVIDDDGTHSIGQIQDHRKSPGGVVFGKDGIDPKKREYSDELLRKNLPERVRAIGGVIQEEC